MWWIRRREQRWQLVHIHPQINYYLACQGWTMSDAPHLHSFISVIFCCAHYFHECIIRDIMLCSLSDVKVSCNMCDCSSYLKQQIILHIWATNSTVKCCLNWSVLYFAYSSLETWKNDLWYCFYFEGRWHWLADIQHLLKCIYVKKLCQFNPR